MKSLACCCDISLSIFLDHSLWQDVKWGQVRSLRSNAMEKYCTPSRGHGILIQIIRRTPHYFDMLYSLMGH